MDATEFTVFLLKDKKYYLHNHIIKDCPIFEQMKESTEIETVVYENEIGHTDINKAFQYLYTYKLDFQELSISSITKIYDFLKFINICNNKITDFIKSAFNTKKYKDLIEYGVENDCCIDYFKLVSLYHTKKEQFDTDWIKNLKVDTNVKKFIMFDTVYLRVEYSKFYYDVYYASIVLHSIPTFTSNMQKWYINEIKNNYKHILNKDITERQIKVTYKNNLFDKLLINDKEVQLYGDTTITDSNYIGINIKDTIVNHIADIIMGNIEL